MNVSKNAQVLDVGTGHGAVLMEIAKRLQVPGKVIGIDIWSQNDQSNNSADNTQTNIDNQQLGNVSQLLTADMINLPFDDESFDFVVASMSIHNVKPAENRRTALSEAYRVLKPGGEIIIIDIEHISQYKKVLQQLGAQEISISIAGIDGMWAMLFTKVIRAKKPDSSI